MRAAPQSVQDKHLQALRSLRDRLVEASVRTVRDVSDAETEHRLLAC